MEGSFSKKPGSLLAIMITGRTEKYIAEIIEEDPLVLKVEESGPFARLKEEDFIIMDRESAMAQGSEAEQQELLATAAKNKHPFISGLESLGVPDGKCHEILPVETAK